jgi:hypothetical protein
MLDRLITTKDTKDTKKLLMLRKTVFVSFVSMVVNKRRDGQ